jgi:hypothetical protein
MLDLLHSKLYAESEDVELLRNEPDYVNKYNRQQNLHSYLI